MKLQQLFELRPSFKISCCLLSAIQLMVLGIEYCNQIVRPLNMHKLKCFHSRTLVMLSYLLTFTAGIFTEPRKDHFCQSYEKKSNPLMVPQTFFKLSSKYAMFCLWSYPLAPQMYWAQVEHPSKMSCYQVQMLDVSNRVHAFFFTTLNQVTFFPARTCRGHLF